MRNSAAVLLLLLLFSSCHFGGRRVRGNGNQISQTRSVGAFTDVRVTSGMDAVIRAGNAPGVTVQTDANLQQYILTEVQDGVLVIRERNNYNLRPSGSSSIQITAPSLNQVTVSGSGSVTSAEKLSSSNLAVKIHGSGDVSLNVDAPQVAAETNGSGTITLSGATRALQIDIRGSGDLRCFDLMSENTNVVISGSGSAQVFASKKLDVEIRGSGDVAYKGTPAVQQRLMGSGSVRSAQ